MKLTTWVCAECGIEGTGVDWFSVHENWTASVDWVVHDWDLCSSDCLVAWASRPSSDHCYALTDTATAFRRNQRV